jgi:hypothetical protein
LQFFETSAKAEIMVKELFLDVGNRILETKGPQGKTGIIVEKRVSHSTSSGYGSCGCY